MTTCVKCLPGKLIRNSVPKVSDRGQSRMHPLSNTYQNSRFPKGKVFSINCIACTVYSYQLGNGGNLSEIQLPWHQPTASLSKDHSRRPAVLTLLHSMEIYKHCVGFHGMSTLWFVNFSLLTGCWAILQYLFLYNFFFYGFWLELMGHNVVTFENLIWDTSKFFTSGLY